MSSVTSTGGRVDFVSDIDQIKIDNTTRLKRAVDAVIAGDSAALRALSTELDNASKVVSVGP